MIHCGDWWGRGLNWTALILRIELHYRRPITSVRNKLCAPDASWGKPFHEQYSSLSLQSCPYSRRKARVNFGTGTSLCFERTVNTSPCELKFHWSFLFLSEFSSAGISMSQVEAELKLPLVKNRKVELLHHVRTLPTVPAMCIDSCQTSWYLDWT